MGKRFRAEVSTEFSNSAPDYALGYNPYEYYGNEAGALLLVDTWVITRFDTGQVIASNAASNGWAVTEDLGASPSTVTVTAPETTPLVPDGFMVVAYGSVPVDEGGGDFSLGAGISNAPFTIALKNDYAKVYVGEVFGLLQARNPYGGETFANVEIGGNSVAFVSRDGKNAVTITGQYVIDCVYDDAIRLTGLPDDAVAVCELLDGKYLYAKWNHYVYYKVDPSDGYSIETFVSGEVSRVASPRSSVAFSPGGDMIAIGSGGAIAIIRLSDMAYLRSLEIVTYPTIANGILWADTGYLYLTRDGRDAFIAKWNDTDFAREADVTFPAFEPDSNDCPALFLHIPNRPNACIVRNRRPDKFYIFDADGETLTEVAAEDLIAWSPEYKNDVSPDGKWIWALTPSDQVASLGVESGEGVWVWDAPVLEYLAYRDGEPAQFWSQPAACAPCDPGGAAAGGSSTTAVGAVSEGGPDTQPTGCKNGGCPKPKQDKYLGTYEPLGTPRGGLA